MYHWHTKVRYSEVNEHAGLTVTSLINYLQDSCTFQSEDLSVGVDFLKKHHSAWVILGWQIEIFRMPRFMDEIDVQTWPYDFKGFYGYRNFRICDKEGTCLVQANSLWGFVNLDTGRPTRLFPEVTDPYIPMDPPLPMDLPPKKIVFQEGDPVEEQAPFLVQRHHLDTNHHVNNGQYVQMAMEYLKEEKEIARIRVVYRRAAVLGDRIFPSVAARDDRLQVELGSGDRTPYAVVELIYRQ